MAAYSRSFKIIKVLIHCGGNLLLGHHPLTCFGSLSTLLGPWTKPIPVDGNDCALLHPCKNILKEQKFGWTLLANWRWLLEILYMVMTSDKPSCLPMCLVISWLLSQRFLKLKRSANFTLGICHFVCDLDVCIHMKTNLVGPLLNFKWMIWPNIRIY